MSGKKDVLYCGDGTLETGARYLGGIMALLGIGFDYIKTETPFPAELPGADYRLIILSDYPSRNFNQDTLTAIARKIGQGTSLLMIGGWASFHGSTGDYQQSTLAQILPVDCLPDDDRLNRSQGFVPEVVSAHPILDSLPWDEPPVICGCNQVHAKPDSKVLLALRQIAIKDQIFSLQAEALPLLVLGHYGRGKTGALTVDLAPHWVGGMIDWGDRRITAQTESGQKIEVGHHYVTFIRNILDYFLVSEAVHI